MNRRRNPQQRKEAETMASPADLSDMDRSKMSEIEFRITVMKSIARLEKTISGNVESLEQK